MELGPRRYSVREPIRAGPKILDSSRLNLASERLAHASPKALGGQSALPGRSFIQALTVHNVPESTDGERSRTPLQHASGDLRRMTGDARVVREKPKDKFGFRHGGSRVMVRINDAPTPPPRQGAPPRERPAKLDATLVGMAVAPASVGQRPVSKHEAVLNNAHRSSTTRPLVGLPSAVGDDRDECEIPNGN